MTHRCLKCSTLHPEMVMMCECGSKAFFFQRIAAKDLPDEEGRYTIDIATLLGREIIEESEGKYRIGLESLQRKK